MVRGLVVLGWLLGSAEAGAALGTTLDGKMSGGGAFSCRDGNAAPVKAMHGFVLECDADESPNRLHVAWGGNRFHLESYQSAVCMDYGYPEHPRAAFNTLLFSGGGRYNGIGGATIAGTLVDNGEPGRDTLQLEIRDSRGTLVLACDGPLIAGGHEAR